MTTLPPLTDETFSSAVQHGTWVVEFWSPTCGPCRIVSPALAELAREFSPNVQFGAVNVDEALEAALKNRVMSVPAVIMYIDGRPVDVMISSYPKHVYRERIIRLAEAHGRT